MANNIKPAPENNYLKDHIKLLRHNYQRLLGTTLTPFDTDDNPLTDKPTNAAEAAAYLFLAPMVLLSHNNAEDPVFNYANQAGLALFELSWDELIHLPSRHSAEAINRDERQKLLAQVSAQGYIENYQGIRISKSGKRFHVHNATVWNLHDSQGVYQGQAACFSDWTFIP